MPGGSRPVTTAPSNSTLPRSAASGAPSRCAAPTPPAAPAAPAAPSTYPAGTRVLVALADGLLHAGTVRQAMDGYYELEIGGADVPLWIHGNAVTIQP